MDLAFYVTDKDGNLTTTTNIDEWVKWYSDISNRRVGYTVFPEEGQLFTTFIASFKTEGELVGLFHGWETMWEPLHGSARFWRWDTLEAARSGHDFIVNAIQTRKYSLLEGPI
jgi:hypothetical protein